MATIASFFAKEIQKLSEEISQKSEALQEATGNKKLAEVIEENVRLKRLLARNPENYFPTSSQISQDTQRRLQELINKSVNENQTLSVSLNNALQSLSQKDIHISQLQSALKSSEISRESISNALSKKNHEIQNSEQNKIVVSEKLAQSSILHEQGILQLRSLWTNEKSQIQAYFMNREAVKNKEINDLQQKIFQLNAEKGKLLSDISYFNTVLENVSSFITEKEEAIRAVNISQKHYVSELEGENRLLRQELLNFTSKVQEMTVRDQRITQLENEIEKSKVFSEGVIGHQNQMLTELKEYIRQYQLKLQNGNQALNKSHLENSNLSSYVNQGFHQISILEKKLQSREQEVVYYKNECIRFKNFAEEIAKEARSASNVPSKVVEELYGYLRSLSNELVTLKGFLHQSEAQKRLSESSMLQNSQEIQRREVALNEWINKAQYFYGQWSVAMEQLNSETANYQRLASSCLNLEKEIKQVRSLQSSGFLEEARKKLIESNMDEIIIRESLTYKTLESKYNHLSSLISSFQAEIDLLKRALSNVSPQFYAKLETEIQPILANNRVLNESLIKAYSEIDELKKGKPSKASDIPEDKRAILAENHSQKSIISKLSSEVERAFRDLESSNKKIFQLEEELQDQDYKISELESENERSELEKAGLLRLVEELKGKLHKVESFVNEIEN